MVVFTVKGLAIEILIRSNLKTIVVPPSRYLDIDRQAFFIAAISSSSSYLSIINFSSNKFCVSEIISPDCDTVLRIQNLTMMKTVYCSTIAIIT